MNLDDSFKTSRRRLLYMLGLGAAGAIVADKLFATQFAREASTVKLPKMVYDPGLQMMVDPVTRLPVYARAEMLHQNNVAKKAKSKKTRKAKSKALPTVTAGCSNCPKCDDHCG
jgi:hypothetical protein